MITTLTGENDTLRQEALQKLVRDFVAEHTDMGLERFDGDDADYARMHEAAQSLPFLASRKLIVLRSPGANKEFIEHFEQFAGDISETNDVVIVESKIDKRLSYYKQLKKLTEFKEFAVLDPNGLTRYLADYAKAQGGNLSAGDARVLIDRVGTNQLIARNEVDKLLAYDPKITRATIETLTERTPQSSIFELLEAAFSGNVQRAMKLYDEQREMRVEPQQIIAMAVWQLHLLALAKVAGSRSADTVAKEAKLNPYTVRKSFDLARHISGPQLKKLITDLRIFDARLKRESLNADEVVRFYLLNLAER